MNKHISKILCFFLAGAITISLAACVKGPTTGGDVNTRSNGTGDKTEKKVTLKLWHIWAADTETQKKPFEQILKDFQKENPNIKLQVDAYENETYKTKIKTAVAVQEAPDIFFTWGAGFAKPFVTSNSVLPLDDYLKDGTREKISKGMFDYFIYDEKIYGLPMYMWSAVLYCNQELFDKNDVKIPETYEELLTAVKAFNSKGIVPLTCGEKERWPGMFFQNILAIRTAGVKKCNEALSGEASFNQPEFVESAAKLEELVKAGAFDKGAMALTKDESEAAFKQGKVAMYYMGNWPAGSFDADDSPIKGKVVCRNFPAITDSKGDANGFLGGSIESFMISSNTQAKEEAVKVVKYISEKMSEQASVVGFGMPAWNGEIDKSKILPTNAQIFELVKDTTGYVLAWDTFLEGADADTHKSLVAEIFAGTKTPEQFAEEMQKINENKAQNKP
ncbi:MAG: extracellular solute-binding protein [Clostridiaceae bacterium]|nr:extracellular solute-binding protein [Clostridiaceae bacterium]